MEVALVAGPSSCPQIWRRRRRGWGSKGWPRGRQCLRRAGYHDALANLGPLEWSRPSELRPHLLRPRPHNSSEVSSTKVYQVPVVGTLTILELKHQRRPSLRPRVADRTPGQVPVRDRLTSNGSAAEALVVAASGAVKRRKDIFEKHWCLS